MPDDDQKKRKDAGVPRVKTTRDAKRLSVYLAGYGVEAKIATAIENDIKILRKDDPDANEQDVLKNWVAEHLGLKGQS